MLWKWLAWMLRRWADAAFVENNRILRHENADLKSKLAISDGEVKRLASNHEMWCQRMMAEARVEKARGAIIEALNQAGERD